MSYVITFDIWEVRIMSLYLNKVKPATILGPKSKNVSMVSKFDFQGQLTCNRKTDYRLVD